MYRNPVDLVSARTFADPPLNIVELVKSGGSFLQNGQPAFAVPSHLAGIPDGPITAAFHPHHLYPDPTNAAAAKLQAKTLVSEIAGSESFIHLDFAGHRWVMLTRGILDIEPDRQIDIYLDTRHLMAFDVNGRSLATPSSLPREEIETWHVSVSTISATPTNAKAKAANDYALKEVHHAGAMVAPMRCSARPAVARPPCSISFPASSIRPTDAFCLMARM